MCQFEVFAPEGDDPYLGFLTCEPGQSVAVQAGAVDQVGTLIFAVRGCDENGMGRRRDGLHLVPEEHFAAGSTDQTDEGGTDCPVVHDGSGFDAEGLHAVEFRFIFEGLGLTHHSAGNTVLNAPVVQLLQRRELGFRRRDNEFATRVRSDAMLPCEREH